MKDVYTRMIVNMPGFGVKSAVDIEHAAAYGRSPFFFRFQIVVDRIEYCSYKPIIYE